MSPLPLYETVESVLAAGIADGTMPAETQLPPEESLVDRFMVSRTTVRKAIQNLIERGLVEIRRGKGTFVARPKITQELTELTGFVEDMQALGRTPGARLLDKRIVAADEIVARNLALSPGTLVFRFQRVRLADNVAMSFDETYLPHELGEKVAGNDLEAEPVFALLEEKYNTPLVEAEYKLEASAADPVVAEALKVPNGSPIFLIERTSYTTGNRPVDYERLHYRADLIRFVTRLARRPSASAQAKRLDMEAHSASRDIGQVRQLRQN
jgi:GntR family transcriptional regulator